ncbi:MAG: 5-formyltetrahydrofolate cyclo-ligase [Myxococcota bacterium]
MIHDPDTLAFLQDRARKQIRSRMRALRRAHPEAALGERSARIVERVADTEAYRAARSLALFWPLSGEVDLRGLDARARAENKAVYYPVMDPNGSGFTTGFAITASTEELATRRSRFLEPLPEAPRAVRGEIDLVLVPALAVGADGNRLGYGGGFYDVTLPDFVPPAVSLIVAYDFQLLAEIPALPHDVACQLVVTDARTLVATPRT